jgi:hypothetical protein
MNHLKRRGGAHHTATLNAKKPGCFDEKKRPKPFAAAEARVTHRVDEASSVCSVASATSCKRPSNSYAPLDAIVYFALARTVFVLKE